jgi:SAM-dependent methyltransferase
MKNALTNLSDCDFYHTIDLPELGTIDGQWDLRPGIAYYFGNAVFKGKRVLDVGCANGFLSFHLEKQGAEVVSFDLDPAEDWDIVPFAKMKDLKEKVAGRKIEIRRLNNAYDLCHKLLKSKAESIHGSVYKIPSSIGTVDVTVFGSILLHLRDPFLALQSALRLTRETVVVTDAYCEDIPPSPSLLFLPDPETLHPFETWWYVNPEWVKRALGVLGFGDISGSLHTQKHKSGDKSMFTIVGRRTTCHGFREEQSPS